MITKENWQEKIFFYFNQIFDTHIYEIKINKESTSIFLRRTKSSALGFCMFTFYERSFKNRKLGLNYIYNDGFQETKFVKVYDDLHIKHIIEYELLEQELLSKRNIIFNYGKNIALTRDLKINSILNEE